MMYCFYCLLFHFIVYFIVYCFHFLFQILFIFLILFCCCSFMVEYAVTRSKQLCGIVRDNNVRLSLLRNSERRLDSNLMSVFSHKKVFAACSTHVALIILSPKV
jgi:hypothetical protein